MSVQKDESGKRYIQCEIEVPGTPEDVWKAIATGPGIASWFMPIEMSEEGSEPHVGGGIYMGCGEQKQKVGEYTAWDPPRCYIAEGKSWGPDAPTVAHEWQVEARAGGTCRVRVVNSYFADSGDWDNQLGDLEGGWPRFFRILRRYMTHFAGQPCSTIHLMCPTTLPAATVWDTLVDALGIKGAQAGAAWTSVADGVARLSGTVESVKGDAPYSAILSLDGPVNGTVSPLAFTVGGQTMMALGVYVYGDGAAEFAASEEPAFQAWMSKNFPMG